MSTKFFTNEDENTLLRRFAGVFEHLPNIAFFDALVGYFRSSGYFAIRPHLDNVPHIRILVGINVDNMVARYHEKGLLFKGDPQMALDDFTQAMKADIQGATYAKDVEDGVLQFVADVVNGKVEIKAHPHRKLHAKIYIFRPETFNEYSTGEVITGSSNLTDAGLGTTDRANYEFNVALRDYDDVKFASDEFEKLWQEGVRVLPVDVQKVTQSTYLNDTFTPYEVYLKFLIEYFGKSVEFDPNSISDLPDGFKRLSYQIDAVEQGFDLLKRHNGFFLADVVGLGKTVVGALIAKKFFYYNDFPSHISTTLIVTPPALRPYWRETLDAFELKNYDIVNNGSLHNIRNPEKYDLILVDEAHKFRNDMSDAYNELQKLCKSPSSRRLKDGSRASKKVVLISATPLNNRPADIRNLVLLFQDGKRSTLEISNLTSFFAKIIDEYKEVIKLPLNEARAEVAKLYVKVREKVIKPLTIRRTRTDLLAHDEYKQDLERQGIRFPHVQEPYKVLYELEPALEMLYDKTVFVLSAPGDSGGLTYHRYQALRFLAPDKKLRYQNAELISRQLAMLMKTQLVKRIDSSFTAFRGSLTRFFQATGAMITMFTNGKIYIAPNLKVSQYILDGKEDELLDKISSLMMEGDPTIMICAPDDFEAGFLAGLKQDYDTLQVLVEQWNAVEDDPKFDTFYRELETRLLDPAHNPQRKLVVFSESQETTAYLVHRLKEKGHTDVMEIHGGNRKDRMPIIRANFDANLPKTQWKDDCNIVITTEVLAEGVNLHRANTIVNYDTPWNSTRLMQRIGRVNRIGSITDTIFIYNFYPTAKVDNDIELRKKAITKLQAFHSALGEDSQIYSTDEEVESFGIFEKNLEESRDKRLAYLMKLREFKRDHPSDFLRIKNMPLRARSGRKKRILHGGTLSFIRSQKRDAFSFINNAGELLELTFLEAAKEFESTSDEKALALHDKHHAHVTQAIEAFQAQIEADRKLESVVDATLSPQDKKALSFLAAFTNLQEVSDGEKAVIRAAQAAIKAHKYNQLPKKINRLARAIKKDRLRLDVIIKSIIDLLEEFPLQTQETAGRYLMLPPARQPEEPEIIISESFA